MKREMSSLCFNGGLTEGTKFVRFNQVPDAAVSAQDQLGALVDVRSSQSGKALFETVGRECAVPPSIAVNSAGITGARHYLTDTPEDDFDDVVRVNLKVDVGCSQSVKALFETVARECAVPLSIVVNCAGIIGERRHLTDTPEDDFDDVVRGTFLVTQAAAKAMTTGNFRNGCIVNVASIAAKLWKPRRTVYSATKAAVVALTKVAAKELASQGIRVNVVLPNTIDTPLLAPSFRENPDEKAGIAATIPLGRIGRPEEVAEVIKFLCGKAMWTPGESKLPLEYYTKYYPVIAPMKKFSTKKAMFGQIAIDIQSILGITRTALQCENHFKTLLKRKKNTQKVNQTSGSSRCTVEFEEQFARIRSMDDNLEPEVRRGVNTVIYKSSTAAAENATSSKAVAEENSPTSPPDEHRAETSAEARRRRRQVITV
ncbi:hypothetical protein HPB47_019334 [Ixodes persulcatus]|uniref:Uncharacterized protein n=1 Tax=Ixodes persulcatus TaxID=34615 RepID=A0AC60QIJ5_IXOPE|nr:hypothetical protein HPB47_019334 [Ixodes persulcatus]